MTLLLLFSVDIKILWTEKAFKDSLDENFPVTVETDASNTTVAAALN